MATGGASAEFADKDLLVRWHALIDGGDPRFTLVSPVGEALETLTRFEKLTRTSLWNMQRHLSIDGMRSSAVLNARAKRKHVELRYVLPRRVAEQRCPLASSHYDYLRLAPVAHPLLISDGGRVLVGDSTGEAIWTSSDPGVVAEAVAFYERVWRSAVVAVPPGQKPPYTPRMVDIALLLVTGATDREIARALGVSERTVSADVREMSSRLGARSRMHAIALISGVDG